jgi:hypothetical protein
MNKYSKILIFFTLTVLLKQVLWSAFVPAFHFPDEQAHFGQAAFIAEL